MTASGTKRQSQRAVGTSVAEGEADLAPGVVDTRF
jgi:hypothetical protein